MLLGTSNSIMSASTSTDILKQGTVYTWDVSCMKAQSQNLSYPRTQAFTNTLEQEMVYTWDFLLNESTVTKFKLSQY